MFEQNFNWGVHQTNRVLLCGIQLCFPKCLHFTYVISQHMDGNYSFSKVSWQKFHVIPTNCYLVWCNSMLIISNRCDDVSTLKVPIVILFCCFSYLNVLVSIFEIILHLDAFYQEITRVAFEMPKYNYLSTSCKSY